MECCLHYCCLHNIVIGMLHVDFKAVPDSDGELSGALLLAAWNSFVLSACDACRVEMPVNEHGFFKRSKMGKRTFYEETNSMNKLNLEVCILCKAIILENYSNDASAEQKASSSQRQTIL